MPDILEIVLDEYFSKLIFLPKFSFYNIALEKILSYSKNNFT